MPHAQLRTETYLHEGFPLIRMNTAVTEAFLVPAFRRQMAYNWLQKYGRQGVGLCTNKLKLVAYVRPNGTLHILRPPFVRFQMWQMANAPRVFSVEQPCACAGFFDPEVQGPWKERGLHPQHHHPFCQFSPSADNVFRRAADEAFERLKRHQNPQARPDEWLRMQREASGA